MALFAEASAGKSKKREAGLRKRRAGAHRHGGCAAIPIAIVVVKDHVRHFCWKSAPELDTSAPAVMPRGGSYLTLADWRSRFSLVLVAPPVHGITLWEAIQTIRIAVFWRTKGSFGRDSNLG